MIKDILEDLAEKSAAVKESEDYEVDGLLYCGKCRTAKQCRVHMYGVYRVVGCLCDCGNKRYKAERERMKQEEERLKVDSLRLTGIADKGLRECKFETAVESPVIVKCRRYAERWDDARSLNLGLLLWGDTGGGKTYAAACVANYLIDHGTPALITSFPRILASGYREREELLDKISRFPLLVLDDLGAERETEAALETVYSVIDERYKSGKPMIATTNLQLKKIQDPGDMTHKRIYDRVLEMCTPVLVAGGSYRMDARELKLDAAREILGGKV